MGRASKAERQGEKDMKKMRSKHGVDYVGYHESLAKGEKTTAKQRKAYNMRMQEQGKKNSARKK